MTASIAKLPWHRPHVRILEWPVLAGPMQAFHIIIKDGHGHTFRSIPIVTRTARKFDAHNLITTIVDTIGHNMSALELGRALKLLSFDGENFGGYYVKHERRETDGVVWRIYPAM
jgi:hypothetical protein